jgi:hypothetical protein
MRRAPYSNTRPPSHAMSASARTRALEITELAVPHPVMAVDVSPAYIFRKVGSEDGVTILFDEIDGANLVSWTVWGGRIYRANDLISRIRCQTDAITSGS